MQIVAVDIGGTEIKHALINEGQILKKGRTKTVATSPQQFVTLLADIVKTYETDSEFMAIGISFPGFINGEKGVATFAGALDRLHGIALRQLLSAALDERYPIFMENDANCAAMAEKLNGRGVDNRDFVVVTVGTGIGGGIFINNQIVRGKEFRAGEFGMMILDKTHSPQTVFSSLGSTQTLIENYRRLKGLAADEPVDGQTVFDQSEEPLVSDLLTNWSRDLAIGICNVVTVLNPEKVLIGGGISANPKLLPLLKEQLATIHYWVDFEVPIETCFHLNDAGLIGAYYLVQESYHKIEK